MIKHLMGFYNNLLRQFSSIFLNVIYLNNGLSRRLTYVTAKKVSTAILVKMIGMNDKADPSL